MSENSYSSENSNTWAVRYTKKELQWDDIKRIGKEIIPVVLLLFFVAMYLVMFLYTQMALKEGISDSQKKIILLKAFIIPLISTGMLFNILSNPSQKLIKSPLSQMQVVPEF